MILEQRVRRNLQRLNEMGFTQQKLASFAAVSRVQINRILRGEVQPKLKTCAGIALALGLDPLAMFFTSDDFDRITRDEIIQSHLTH